MHGTHLIEQCNKKNITLFQWIVFFFFAGSVDSYMCVLLSPYNVLQCGNYLGVWIS